METKDILTSLAELETNLQAIKSARQQVEDTIASCQEIGKVAGSYSVALEGISTALGEVISGLKERQDFIDANASAIMQDFREQCDTNIKIQSDAVKSISETFKKDSNAIIDAAKAEFKKQVDNLDSTLSTKSLALTTSIGNLNTEIAKLESLYSLIKTTLEGIGTLKNDVNQLGATLSNSQAKQDEDLSTIKQQIDDFLKNVKSQFLSLSQNLTSSQNGQDKELAGVSKMIVEIGKNQKSIDSANKKSTTKLNDELLQIKSELKNNKLFNIAVIIGIIVLIILLLLK